MAMEGVLVMPNARLEEVTLAANGVDDESLDADAATAAAAEDCVT